MILSDLRAQAMDDLTPDQLRAASDAALLLCGWTWDGGSTPGGPWGPEEHFEGFWYPPNSNKPYDYSDLPNPAASRDDSAALMPDGQAVQVNVFGDTAIVTSWHCDEPTDQNGEQARTEPYARMLAAVAAHLEEKP